MYNINGWKQNQNSQECQDKSPFPRTAHNSVIFVLVYNVKFCILDAQINIAC
jgi:hypothetical protein